MESLEVERREEGRGREGVGRLGDEREVCVVRVGLERTSEPGEDEIFGGGEKGRFVDVAVAVERGVR